MERRMRFELVQDVCSGAVGSTRWILIWGTSAGERDAERGTTPRTFDRARFKDNGVASIENCAK